MGERPTIVEPRRSRQQQQQQNRQFEAGDDVRIDYKDGKLYEAIIHSVQMEEEEAPSPDHEVTTGSSNRPGQRVGSRNRGITGDTNRRALSYTVEFANGEVEENVSASNIRHVLEDSD